MCFCEIVNENLPSLKCGDFPYNIRNYRLLKKDSAPLSYNEMCGFINSIQCFVATKP